MKITITFKDPDQVYEGITEALEETDWSGMHEDEVEILKEKRRERYQEICSEWFKWGEYITLEVDTETKTIRVVPANEANC